MKNKILTGIFNGKHRSLIKKVNGSSYDLATKNCVQNVCALTAPI